MIREIIYDITVYAGANYTLDMAYIDDDENPIDMSGWYVEATLREFAECADGIDFFCISDSDGVHIFLTSEQTGELGYSLGEYDVFITDPDNTTRVKLIKGKARIYANGARNI